MSSQPNFFCLAQGCPPGTDAEDVSENVCGIPVTTGGDTIPNLGVNMTYETNSGAPSFNFPEIKGKIDDAETCPCTVAFDENYFAVDLDGVEYSVYPAQPYSSMFDFTDKRDLKSLTLKDVVSQNTAIDLVIEVKGSWENMNENTNNRNLFVGKRFEAIMGL